MKDQDNKTNAICYCKSNTAVDNYIPKAESKSTSIRHNQNKIDAGAKQQPWSMFGEWYWI